MKNLEPIHFRHHHIQQYSAQGILLGQNQRQSFPAIFSLLNFITLLKDICKQCAVQLGIINNQ